MKTCATCKEEKPLIEFGKRSASIDGLMYSCKKCWNLKNAIQAGKEESKARKAAYQDANIDQHKATVKRYKAKNAEKIREANAEYRKKNLEKLKKVEMAWRVKNKERIKATGDDWRIKNPERARIHVQNRRAKKRENGGSLSSGIVNRLRKLQKGKCACCGLPLGDNFDIDHIIPIHLGGSNTDSNVQLLRQRCNRQKSAKHPVVFMQERGFLL